jgi:ATP-dependent helicase/nuclease subunit A
MVTAVGSRSAAIPAHPQASVWVAASAGTGKTTVLTGRLLRLMLDGTDPARILCLTFTRAAAAEMANRLDDVLADWATLPDGELARTLQSLTGEFAGRHQDFDDPRILPNAIAPLPARGRRVAGVHCT